MRLPRHPSHLSLALAVGSLLSGPAPGATNEPEPENPGVWGTAPQPMEIAYQNMAGCVEKPKTHVNTEKLPRRNDKCPCGSRRKFKKCCLHARQAAGHNGNP